jgi:hypothetical protein
MPKYLLRFTLEGLPKMTNAGNRAHWAVKVKEARKWHDEVRRACFNKLPEEPLKKAKITMVRFSSVEPDYDGLASGFKHVLDGLVRAGVLISDKMSVTGKPNYSWDEAPPKRGYIQVDVESID